MTSRRFRLLIASSAGIAAAVVAAFVPHAITVAGVGVGDIAAPLFAMLRFIHHQPVFAWRINLGPLPAYPFTTTLVLSPLLLVPVRLIAPAFCGLSTFFLAFAIAGSKKPWLFLMFFTPAFAAAIVSVQFSPLITAAILMPSLLPISVVKPQLGLVAAASGKWSRTTIGVAAAIVVLSLLIYPQWPLDWLRTGSLAIYDGRAPIAVVPGFLLALSLFAIRSREGRVLASMSVVRQRFYYDQLPLFLVAESWTQMVLLLAGAWASAGVNMLNGWSNLERTAQDSRSWTSIILGMYVPALSVALWNAWKRRQSSSRSITTADSPSG
jgi:hypothetical protein